MTKYLLAFLFLLAIDAKADAVEIGGLGARTCQSYIDLVSHDDLAQAQTAVIAYTSWHLGYMSALNQTITVTSTDLSDASIQAEWLQQYCLKNPAISYHEAVIGLWRDLRHSQGLEVDPRLTIWGMLEIEVQRKKNTEK